MLHSRISRVAELIKEELGEIIDQKLNNPRIPPFVTVHSVKVSKDLRAAEVFITFLQDEDPKVIEVAVAELNRAAGFIRGELGRRVTLRYLPQLRFHYNPSTRYAGELEQIFKELSANESPARDEAAEDTAADSDGGPDPDKAGDA